MRLLKASILTIAIVFVISVALTWTALKHNLMVPFIAGSAPCVIGILIGAGGHYITKTLLGQWFPVRILSAIACGVIAGLIDAAVFIGGVESSPDSAALYAAELIGAAYTVLIASVMGFIFGAGAGQRKRLVTAEPEE